MKSCLITKIHTNPRVITNTSFHILLLVHLIVEIDTTLLAIILLCIAVDIGHSLAIYKTD